MRTKGRKPVDRKLLETGKHGKKRTDGKEHRVETGGSDAAGILSTYSCCEFFEHRPTESITEVESILAVVDQSRF